MSEPKIRKLLSNDNQGKGKETKQQLKCPPPASLPPELWELIFKEIESPKDLLTCWNTALTSAWSTALRSTDLYFKMTLQFLLPYLSRNDLLTLSSVSKFWNATLDVGIQTAEDTDSDRRLNREQRIQLKLLEADLSYFIKKVGLSKSIKSTKKLVPVNPVVFRRVFIDLDLGSTLTVIGPGLITKSLRQVDVDANAEPIIIIENNFMQCLDHFGHLIRYLYICLGDDDNTSCLDKIKLIRKSLERTPNLRVLEISTFDDEDELNSELEAFNHYNSENPWPPLQHLKVLKFGEFTCTNRAEYASIANAYATQLVHFQFGFPMVERGVPLRLLPSRFSFLQKIGFLVCAESVSAIQLKEFMQSCHCPLKQLTVVFNDEPQNVNHCDGLTVAVNSAGATLETLDFHPRKVHTNGRNSTITKFDELRLPNLKMLTLDTYGYPSLQFLLSVCPAIEQLTLIPVLPDPRGWTELVDGDMYIDLYSEHQFWNKLARIERVDVEIAYSFEWILVNGKREKLRREIPGGKERKIYTRSEYQAKLKEDRVKSLAIQTET